MYQESRQCHFQNVRVLPAAPNSASTPELQILKTSNLEFSPFLPVLSFALSCAAVARLGGENNAALAQVHRYKVVQ